MGCALALGLSHALLLRIVAVLCPLAYLEPWWAADPLRLLASCQAVPPFQSTTYAGWQESKPHAVAAALAMALAES